MITVAWHAMYCMRSMDTIIILYQYAYVLLGRTVVVIRSYSKLFLTVNSGVHRDPFDPSAHQSFVSLLLSRLPLLRYHNFI